MSIKLWHLKKEQFFSQFFHLSLFSQLNHCQKIQALQLSIFNFCMSTELFFSTTQNQRQEAQFSNKLFHFNSKFNYLRRGGQQKLRRFSQESLHWYIYFFNVGSGLYSYTISGIFSLQVCLINISCRDAPSNWHCNINNAWNS